MIWFGVEVCSAHHERKAVRKPWIVTPVPMRPSSCSWATGPSPLSRNAAGALGMRRHLQPGNLFHPAPLFWMRSATWRGGASWDGKQLCVLALASYSSQ